MKLKIKVKEITEGCMPVIIEKGDWIDLRAAKTITLSAPQAGIQYQKDNNKFRDVTFSQEMIPLGVAIALPKGFEAELKGRSSLTKNYNVLMACSGVIDNSYRGNKDEWLFRVIALDNTTINAGDRICQFRIVLNQKATMWQKIKWLFSSGVKLVKVDNLDGNNRGGFGSSGIR